MLIRFITEVNIRFNPFTAQSRSVRLFLSSIPPTARSQGVAITTKMIPRTSTEKSSLMVKFKDGKVLDLDCENMSVKTIVEECDRHSRALQKQADLADG